MAHLAIVIVMYVGRQLATLVFIIVMYVGCKLAPFVFVIVMYVGCQVGIAELEVPPFNKLGN